MRDDLEILFEDNHLIAVNKKAGDIVQADKTGDVPLSEIIKKYIAEKYNKPGNVYLGMVHRIDRPTSGVVVFARTSKAAARLTETFKKRAVDKIYWAIVPKPVRVKEATLVHYLKKNSRQNKSYVSETPEEGYKEARLSYKIIAESDRYALLEVKLFTGRHHQIRAQLAHIGLIIKGDLKYGAPRSNPDASISLHARSISFLHPVRKEPVTIVAPVPDDKLWKVLEKQVAS